MRWPWQKRDGGPEVRAITPSDVPFNYGGGPLTAVSQDRALSLVPVYAATRLLSMSVSTLPIKAYRRLGDDRSPMLSLPKLFDDLETFGELQPWLHRCMTSLTLRGNAYGLVINRDGYGFPTQIEWLNPGEVTPDDTAGLTGAAVGRAGWFYRGRRVAREDMVHIPWYTLAGKREGLSPIGVYAATVNAGLYAEDYGSTWFQNGGFPPGTFKNVQQTVTPEQAEVVRARLTNAMHTRQPLIHGSDWEYTPITVPPNEAQFIEATKATTNQIASFYGIPPEMIGGETGSSMTYANVEQQQINFVMFTLRPWLVVLERAFSALLPDRQYVRFNADALVRADLRTRHEVYAIDRKIGLRNIDELRALEDLPALPDGQGQDYAPLPSGVNPNTAPPDSPDATVTEITRKWVQPR